MPSLETDHLGRMFVGTASPRLDLGVRDADAHGVPVRRECRVRSQEAGDDLEQKRLAWSLGCIDATLPDIGGGLREATEHSKDRRSNLPDACVRLRAAQSELERPIRGRAGPEKLKRQGLTRPFDVREQMDPRAVRPPTWHVASHRLARRRRPQMPSHPRRPRRGRLRPSAGSPSAKDCRRSTPAWAAAEERVDDHPGEDEHKRDPGSPRSSGLSPAATAC
jgi:hypothetical protein